MIRFLNFGTRTRFCAVAINLLRPPRSSSNTNRAEAMVENKNLILAIVLSVAILFGFDFLYGKLYPKPQTSPNQAPPSQTLDQNRATPSETPAPTPQGVCRPHHKAKFRRQRLQRRRRCGRRREAPLPIP